MSQVEDYVQFEATVNTIQFGDDIIIKSEVLQMVPCSADNFHVPYNLKRDFFLSTLPFAMCVPNH